jgi:hypothetical protein
VLKVASKNGHVGAKIMNQMGAGNWNFLGPGKINIAGIVGFG